MNKRIKQRQRIAKRIKEIRQLPTGQNKQDGIYSLLQIASNYPKIKTATNKTHR